jgi:hypothetical protein
MWIVKNQESDIITGSELVILMYSAIAIDGGFVPLLLGELRG